jgi:hypothetical protein
MTSHSHSIRAAAVVVAFLATYALTHASGTVDQPPAPALDRIPMTLAQWNGTTAPPLDPAVAQAVGLDRPPGVHGLREHGGDIKETYGVPVEEIQEGIRHGVRKVNIDTDIRLAMTAAIRRALAKDTSEFDPRKFFKASIVAAREVCKARFEAFGSAGRASAIRPIALDRIATQYAKAA